MLQAECVHPEQLPGRPTKAMAQEHEALPLLTPLVSCAGFAWLCCLLQALHGTYLVFFFCFCHQQGPMLPKRTRYLSVWLLAVYCLLI